MKRRIQGLGFDLIQACSLTAEVVSVAPSVVWAVLLLMPGCTFCTAHNYGLLAGIPEWLLAWVFVAHLALFLTGWRLRSFRLRRAACRWGTVQWFAVTGAMVAAAPHNTAYVYMVYAATALLGLVQLGFARGRAEAALRFALTIEAVASIGRGGPGDAR